MSSGRPPLSHAFIGSRRGLRSPTRLGRATTAPTGQPLTAGWVTCAGCALLSTYRTRLQSRYWIRSFGPNFSELSSRTTADLLSPPFRATAVVCRRPLSRGASQNGPTLTILSGGGGGVFLLAGSGRSSADPARTTRLPGWGPPAEPGLGLLTRSVWLSSN